MARHLATLTILAALILGAAFMAEWLGIRAIERIVTHGLILLILVLGLQVFMGNSGILSFAHVGFMGIGAYTSAVLTIPIQMKGMAVPDLYASLSGLELSPYLGMIAGGLVAAFVAAVVSYPLMRLSGAAAVITSFALLVVLYTVMTHWSAVTNGPRTLFGIPKATTLPLAAGVALAALAVALAFKDSRAGLLLRASRDDEVAASAIGAHTIRLRWQAFILSALLAGIGGALWGHYITSFSPKAFYLKETFVVLGMLVIGGSTTVTGAVIGTLIVTIAFEALRTVESVINRSGIASDQVVGLTELVLAAAMIAVLSLRPGGMFPAREIGHYFTRRAPRVPDVAKTLRRSP
jgi:branched-chain amino acid transport system permease protein